MAGKYIIALDQGTTSSRAVLFDDKGKLLNIEQKEFEQHFPKPGWVEHDPDEIWSSQEEVLHQLIRNNNIKADEIICLGITNQRETTLIWDRSSGNPVYPAIVWQDKRTARFCEKLKNEGLSDHVSSVTGLVIDSYFSGTKANWILNNVEGVKEKAANGELCFGTVDTWLIWKLTKGRRFVTDVSNASRTMFYDITKLNWDQKLLDVLEISKKMLPEVLSNTSHFGDWEYEGRKIPITGVAGDQQAALFGQTCLKKGMAKNTYGTGCFLLMNIGGSFQQSKNGLVNTIAYQIDDKVKYALEGSIFIAGAAVQWLRDGLKIIDHASDTEKMALRVKDAHEVVVVPALTGIGAPYWDMYARGAIFGITRDTTADHFAKATLDAVAYQTRDILEAMQKDSGIDLKALKVDGGAVANNYLMQFQADILGVPVERPSVIESTAVGAAYLAGIGAGVWDMNSLKEYQEINKVFEPAIEKGQRDKLYQKWQKAVKRTMNWVEKEE
ncbi:MAG: glycerol kinase GlpK [Candidatus Cyclobacteriaceae bacterium M2_1C_046]